MLGGRAHVQLSYNVHVVYVGEKRAEFRQKNRERIAKKMYRQNRVIDSAAGV